LLDGVDLRRIRFASLRARVVLVPQEGFLFDATLLDNIRFGRPEATEDEVRLALTELGLDEWAASLPSGWPPRWASGGSRCRPVSDSSWPSCGPTSPTPTCSSSTRPPRRSTRRPRSACNAPSTRLTRGRTSVAIAHRLSTAEAADEVVVVDAGRIVERGPHRELVAAGGVYAALHASWVTHQS
jgi:ATP-binding cassette subfamily B protein